ncbi:MAG: excinuclease ABC subunit A [Candidatus Komeilibacteria bacterium RIFCSPLOWO2_02_FULL_48_11]|uniref:UvrABC system protein A n=1 Tax=Candidatus Komeilibacteria bacterium RIFCSPLOWO2_02_FULL_48_11 TaxID=1798553 RepID=A0A1G2BWV9_9BACT|nr:MAG: excinuclease ABC subunit A [Candidatus Komeilibacteria bacterium RIFCSPLOWO2_02_FULL_48_11]
MNKTDVISIKGARVHNLKNISLDIPRNKLVVITGISGSGKSSLAFDTIYAEGQRRYVESLSAYARQFLGLMDKPDVDSIDGLSPAISIDQRSASHNPRSTVGTVTEIYDYLRVLFARVGIPHCPNCGRVVAKQSKERIMNQINKLPAETKIIILAPLIRDQKGEHKHVFDELAKAGYARVRLDGEVIPIEEAQDKKIDKKLKHTVEVVVDRLVVKAKPSSDDRSRLADSLETALDLGDGLVIVNAGEGASSDVLYSQHLACPQCHISLPLLEPRSFSFNSPHGACPECSGLGTKLEVDPDLVIPNKRLSIAEGAIRPWSRSASFQGWYYFILKAVAADNGFSDAAPIKSLSDEAIQMILYGTGNRVYNIHNPESQGKIKEYTTTFEGVIPNLLRRYQETDSDYIRREIESYMRTQDCEKCQGQRLKPEALAVTVGDKNLAQITSWSIDESLDYFRHLANGKSPLSEQQMKIARLVLKEIMARLQFLQNVGLSYLTLDRAAHTLSGGEAQRIRLATQIGSALTGVLYILDEPSIGLHQRDNGRLINTLKSLRDLGNTVIVVEHDEETIKSADFIVDIGPGAGEHGGKVVATGTVTDIKRSKDSVTGAFLTGQRSIKPPKSYRRGNGKSIKVVGAEEFNLKKINVEIPLGKLVAITGVSGSGKSTLMTDILAKSLLRHFYRSKDIPGRHKEIQGLENVDKVIDIDQSPIGRTPRSNPATYTGLFTPIRDLFTNLPEAKIRGYKAGRFSFNVPGGRCESCEGDGVKRIEMNFLPDVYVDCEECHGQRYNPQVLEIHYRDKNIADVLALTVDEALSFFKNIPAIKTKLETLHEVGLGYIHLGQSATTLSGGEAQRIKLATELARRATGKTLYILDEPTTGLHFADVERLLHVLHKLVDKGNSVLIIEHNLDVIKSCDWIIDLGPEGGDKGGEVVATGTPKDVARVKRSYTGQYLRRVL